MQNSKPMSAVLTAIAGMATLAVITGAMIVASSRQTMANTEIAQKTGQPCSQCHTTVPELNAYGKKYQESLRK